MEQSVKEEIWNLFFDKLLWIEQIQVYYKNKYTYHEIKEVINEKY